MTVVHMIITAAIYFFGFFLCFKMLRVDQEASGVEYTKGDQLINYLRSCFSWGMIIVILVLAWIKYIGATGYWKKPVTPKPEEKEEAETKQADKK